MNENKNESRRLYRSKINRMIGGVCGGIAEYVSIDPTIARIVWAISVFWGGFGILLYLICMVLIPENPLANKQGLSQKGTKSDAGLLAGALMVIVGLALLSHNAWGFIWPFDWRFWHFWSIQWRYVWPVLIMLIGVWIIVMGIRREKQTLGTATAASDEVPLGRQRKLLRSRKEKMFAGVCGGLAQYWGVDVALVRIGFAFLTVASGFWLGVGAYLIIVMLIPEEAIKIEMPIEEADTTLQPRQKRSRKRNPKTDGEALK
jgi:phage shock protein C